MKKPKTLLLLVIASFSMNGFAMTGRHAQKVALNFGGMIAANLAANIAYADEQNKPETAPDYIDSKKYPEFAKFVAKHRCSPEIEKLVRENHTKKTWIQNNVFKYDEIPFYNKGDNLSRIAYAAEIKKAIKDNNLDHLSVPDKCVCHMYDTTWNVIAKEAQKQTDPSKMSLIEVQQMVKLIKETGLMDMHNYNYFKSNQDIITIIDTENISRRSDNGNLEVFRKYGRQIMEPEAYQWLKKQIEQEIAENSFLTQLYKTLFSSTQSTPAINIDQAQKEYSDYKREEYSDYQNNNNEETNP